jgi:hypothetical protein
MEWERRKMSLHFRAGFTTLTNGDSKKIHFANGKKDGKDNGRKKFYSNLDFNGRSVKNKLGGLRVFL